MKLSSLFLRLLENEHKKILKLKSTWIIFFTIAMIVCCAGYLEYRYLNKQGAPVGGGNVWTFINFLQNVSIFIGLSTISFASSILPKEFTLGTIKLLMIRPARRTTILLSKYVTVLSFMVLFYLTLFISGFVAAGAVYGFATISQTSLPTDMGQANLLIETLDAYGKGMLEIVMYATLAFMLSVLFRSTSLAMGITIPLYFIGGSIAMLIQQYSWAKYTLFVSLALDSAPFGKGTSLGFSLMMLALYFCLFLAVALFSFQKRDV